MKLVIAEKPSVAKAIAAVLHADERKNGFLEGGGYLVSWCIGHLISFADAGGYKEQYRKWNYDDLPIVPQDWQFTVASGKEQQFSILKDLMHREDVTEIVNACDAGREGELIFRFVYEQANCKKPFSRLWISSMEESAIREGFSNLKDGRGYDNLYQSALCRAKADWLIGINATRLFSILYHKTLNVGRVQTPTLDMIVKRDYAIGSFKKEKYHVVRLQAGGITALSEKLFDEAAAQQMKTACEKSQAVCTSLTKEAKTAAPPRLFDLTALQREANRLFGFTAKQTLDYVQALYEKRLLTYPRTDSKYITSDMAGSTEQLINSLCGILPFMQGAALTPDLSRITNNAKVTDHHAILPTAEFVKNGFAGLAESEKKIVTLVCVKLLCAVAAPYAYETVTAVFSCGGYSFTAKGNIPICEGWREIDRRSRSILNGKTDEDEAEPDKALPPIDEGQAFEDVAAQITDHYTQPPKAFTEDTLLSAMETAGKEETPDEAERKGLGTTATRAGIIEKLIGAGFVERSGRKLKATKDGINLTVVLPEVLTSPLLTADWETRLVEIAKGNEDPADFMQGIEKMAADLVKSYSHISEDKAKLFAPQREAIGTCPRCGEIVYEGKKNYYCGNRKCSFVMWKNDRFFEQRKKAFTKSIAAALLKDGKAKVKGLYSTKTGNTFDGVVLLADTGGKYVNYRVEQNRK
ncbi:TPA: DNA topoisomerase 3 [Clostridioides difficile]|nr:DNA topoisomerase 3 [Clostridioides difficile]HEK8908302.1 DNA topoisomerase 3 [Clostridioides difficile]